MALGLLARKKGMTSLVNEAGEMVPVTVLEAGPCTVVSIRTVAAHGYEAVQVGFEPQPKKNRTTRAVAGHFAAAKVPVQRTLQEFRCANALAFPVGQALTVGAFQIGELVDVQGKSKGRGFQGVIKRHGKAGGPAAHGSHFHRTTGSIGMRTWPGRVFKNMNMPGHMGDEFVTTRGLRVVAVDADLNLLFVRGAVPGTRNGLVRVTARAEDFEKRCVALVAQGGEAS